jgi:hypothetical protein
VIVRGTNDRLCKRDETYVLICCAYIRGFFESQYYINTVGDVDWVCVAADRKVWKAPLNVVMSLHVV